MLVVDAQADGDTELPDIESGGTLKGKKAAAKKKEKEDAKDGHFWRDHKEEFMSLLPFLW